MTMRRERPLFGAQVGIEASGADPAAVESAIAAAFEAVELAERRLSFQRKGSTLSRLNRAAHLRAVRVDSWTYEVIERALEIAAASGGAFDPTVGRHLVKYGFLPRPAKGLALATSSFRDVALLPRSRVRFRRALALDLGGIAKGFAVDQALAVLRGAGMASGLVEVGANLAAFGPRPVEIRVRHPMIPFRSLAAPSLENGALAISGPHFQPQRWRGRWVSHLVDPRTGASWTAPASISVQAPTCLVADALTKAAAFGTPEGVEGLFTAYGARLVRLAPVAGGEPLALPA
jgi:thiamine biosynthesis lipoprotein